ncbi:MAG TPA: DUF802 domain-containing protein [Rhodocyclaceae bacterium]
MNRKFCIAAFVAGLLTVAWVGWGYLHSNPLALIMTLIIGAVYGMGALEMRRYDQATASLATALTAIPQPLTNLGDWLDRLHPSLQNPVRLRIEGERSGLPGPALTPYLLGLLVMLGMLGTFLGMVVTLNGAVFALEGTTDLQTMRASLSAPIRGLGLAFGTSVAGVATSAMLGLISALCRGERRQAAQLLDSRIATVLRGFSLAHQRQETFKLLQFQAQALPAVVDKLQAMMDAMAQQNQQLHGQMLVNQEGFHRDVKGVYTDLAGAVDQSLKASLRDSARAAADSIKPIVEATMQGIARETAALQQGVGASLQQQLDGLATRFGSTVGSVEASWAAALAKHESSSERLSEGLQQSLTQFTDSFEQRSAALITSLQADLAQRDQQRLEAMAQSVEAMAAGLQREWQQAGAQTLAQQQQICETMERTARDITTEAQSHASKTINEIGQLMETAAAAPRAAAEVIGQLRQEISNNIARDNALLEERGRIMEALNTLLAAINQGAAEQRQAIDALVTTSTALLERVGGEFVAQVGAESAKMADSATQVGGSAVEIASLGETLGFAVERFGAANERMIEKLERIENALDKSMARSDEQLAYYVAQARELIDLSIMSQKRIVEDIQQLADRQALPAAGVC